MNKPATVLQKEFIENLTKLINSSELPAFVLVDVLKNALSVMQELAEKQYRIDLTRWEEEQKNGDT